jgi:alanine racemase
VLSQPPLTSTELLCYHDLTPAVQDSNFAITYAEVADAMGKTAPYHIKIDTGMHRVGVPANEAAELAQTLEFHRALELKGTFTHFATADEVESFEISRQLKRFEAALEQMRYAGVSPGIVHAANSAATIRYKETHYDMVRLGIAMYGLHPSKLTYQMIDLRPAMSIIARVSSINNVPMGEGVGYGLTYRSPGSVLAATLPLGYADGMSRQLSNNVEVLCRGRVLPQIGRINMDMTSFEVSQRGTARNPRLDVEIGDEVVVVGRSGNMEITLDDLAGQLGTINYELACRFGMRLERVFV